MCARRAPTTTRPPRALQTWIKDDEEVALIADSSGPALRSRAAAAAAGVAVATASGEFLPRVSPLYADTVVPAGEVVQAQLLGSVRSLRAFDVVRAVATIGASRTARAL